MATMKMNPTAATSSTWLRFLLFTILLLQTVSSESCDNEEEDKARGVCSKKPEPEIHWRDFDWKTYVEKDWQPEVDTADPVSRFGIHLRNSIDIGVDREIPEYRYFILEHIST